jgi:hypothetical protein
MSRADLRLAIAVVMFSLLLVTPALADSVFFSTGAPDGKIGTVSRPDSPFGFEIESADDFVLTDPTLISSATFTGLLSSGATLSNIGEVRVEIYRVFPADSDVSRTSGPPTFSTSQVPTRVNSPGDVEFADRDTASHNLTFTATDLGAFTTLNSVGPGGIHPKGNDDNEFTGGNGPVSGEEVQFTVNFTVPFSLPGVDYFFVPLVEVGSTTCSF